MRLIDADELKEIAHEMIQEDPEAFNGGYSYDAVTVEEIDEAPTIEAARMVRWIPCFQRLPEGVKDCLVTLKNGAVFQAQFSGFSQEFRMICWHKVTYFRKDNPVIAWMPLPEPYKGE